MANQCYICRRPLSSTTWADLSDPWQSTSELMDTPLDNKCASTSWGHLRGLETVSVIRVRSLVGSSIRGNSSLRFND